MRQFSLSPTRDRILDLEPLKRWRVLRTQVKAESLGRVHILRKKRIEKIALQFREKTRQLVF